MKPSTLSELIGFAYEISDTGRSANRPRPQRVPRRAQQPIHRIQRLPPRRREQRRTRTGAVPQHHGREAKAKTQSSTTASRPQGEHEPVENSLSRSTEGRIILTGKWVRTEGERSTAVKQDMELRDRSYAWRVWIRPGTSTSDADEAGPWRQIMDGEWIRKEPLDQR